jgi:quercetin dioxygenase-like cupin family protein
MLRDMQADILLRDAAERFDAAGGDDMLLRLAVEQPSQLTVVEASSADRVWVPFHAHPWDELTYVLEGAMEFRVGDLVKTGGQGTMVSLPRGVPHTLRVLDGEARYLMITLGAPSLQFLKEIGHAYSDGPTLERLLAIAARHGVSLADAKGGPGSP